MGKKQSYKKSLERLKAIIQQIENEEPDVDELSGMVKEATQLIEFCKKKIRDTEEDLKGNF
jgi:exodeoxyribonuclease VII small subunit